MKKLFNSSGLLIGLILVLIGVLGNRKAIDKGIQNAIAKVIFNDDNYRLVQKLNSWEKREEKIEKYAINQ